MQLALIHKFLATVPPPSPATQNYVYDHMPDLSNPVVFLILLLLVGFILWLIKRRRMQTFAEDFLQYLRCKCGTTLNISRNNPVIKLFHYKTGWGSLCSPSDALWRT
jgi:hypothetical protein